MIPVGCGTRSSLCAGTQQSKFKPRSKCLELPPIPLAWEGPGTVGYMRGDSSRAGPPVPGVLRVGERQSLDFSQWSEYNCLQWQCAALLQLSVRCRMTCDPGVLALQCQVYNEFRSTVPGPFLTQCQVNRTVPGALLLQCQARFNGSAKLCTPSVPGKVQR